MRNELLVEVGWSFRWS